MTQDCKYQLRSRKNKQVQSYCVECNESLGDSPEQLCRKTYCANKKEINDTSSYERKSSPQQSSFLQSSSPQSSYKSSESSSLSDSCEHSFTSYSSDELDSLGISEHGSYIRKRNDLDVLIDNISKKQKTDRFSSNSEYDSEDDSDYHDADYHDIDNYNDNNEYDYDDDPLDVNINDLAEVNDDIDDINNYNEDNIADEYDDDFIVNDGPELDKDAQELLKNIISVLAKGTREPELTIEERREHKQLTDAILDKDITVKKILSSNLDRSKKIDLLEKYNALSKMPIDSFPYYTVRDRINSELETPIPSHLNVNKLNKTISEYKKEVIASDRTDKVKELLLEQLVYMETINQSSEEYTKMKKWLSYAMNIPIETKPLPIKSTDELSIRQQYAKDTKNKFESAVYKNHQAKNSIYSYIGSLIDSIDYVNGKPQMRKTSEIGNILAFIGKPGTGKTHCAQLLSEVTGLPMIKIKIGGLTHPDALKGSSRVWVGSDIGQIAKGFCRGGFKNAIIFIDEIDKIPRESQTGISGVLIHLFDPETNNEFVDEFLEVPIDLSECLTIVTLNDEQQIHDIVKDRVEPVYFHEYTFEDQFIILRDYMLADLTKKYNLTGQIEFSDDKLRYLMNKVVDIEGKHAEGLRAFRKATKRVLARISSLKVFGINIFDDNTVHTDSAIENNVENALQKFVVTEEFINNCFKYDKVNVRVNHHLYL